MSKNASIPNPVEVFTKSWRTYQDIIQNNYMFHREISAKVFECLKHFNVDQPMRVLDLGCGDASMALPLLDNHRISNYLGCDLSQPALDIANEQLNFLKIPYQLICDDMLRTAQAQPKNSVDLVFSSYAIHHLDVNQKGQLIEAVAASLAPGGIFVLIDIFREPDESRSDYIGHYIDFLNKHWVKLSQESQKLVIEHATAYDFPEHPTFIDDLCQSKGFHPGKQLAKHTWHQAWLYLKHG